jgi:uncharacterized protein YndB with AHSA1/START domain
MMPTDSSASPSTTGKQFEISRTFDAPRDLVFRAFSEAERLAQWWGPKGFTIEVRKLEFRPGGIFHYRMDAPNPSDMRGRFIYREIVPPERIVWVNSFSDPAGGITRAPFAETFPAEILNVMTLTEQDGKTTLSLRGGPIGATAEEQAFFEGMFDSMRQGFGGTWDQLEAYLAKEQRGA